MRSTVALLFVLIASARADIPPVGPVAEYAIQIESAPEGRVIVAYPINRSHGAPMPTYEIIPVGMTLDPGRGNPLLYVLPAQDIVDFPGESVRGVRGAPVAANTASAIDQLGALESFFSALSPRLEVPDAPIDAQVIARATDVFAITLAGESAQARLVRTQYVMRDGSSRTIAAASDGTRGELPLTVTLPAQLTSTVGCGCAVGPRESAPFALVSVLVGLVALVGRRRR